jgi:hypothetical protein
MGYSDGNCIHATGAKMSDFTLTRGDGAQEQLFTAREVEQLVGERTKALREALGAIDKALIYNESCSHGEENWYCDSCKFEWEKRVAEARKQARAILKDGQP